MLHDESRWDDDLVMTFDEQYEFDELEATWDTEEMVADFNRAMREGSLEVSRRGRG